MGFIAIERIYKDCFLQKFEVFHFCLRRENLEEEVKEAKEKAV